MEQQMQIKNSGYSHHGASRGKTSLLHWVSASKSPHEDISQNLPLLRERSRDLYAGGGPLGRGAIDRLTLNAIGSGLKLNVRIDPELLNMAESESRKWAAKAESEFDYWAASKDADFCRMQSFYELQVSAFRALLLDGECLAILREGDSHGHVYGLQVMLIESDRLATPMLKPPGVMIDEGVELDSYGRPCAYWIANRHPDSELSNQPRLEYRRVPLYSTDNRRNIIHLINPERISQHRGVPYLAPVIEQLKQLGRYTDAELMAAVVSGIRYILRSQ
ncbi:MAG: phage portal protein [Synergistaceae bacterium]|nr:phage portal protein [Synergistaceae bacterium]